MTNIVESTLQERLKQKLESVGLPHSEIKVYGSQIMITAIGKVTIQRWASVLARFSKINGIAEAIEYNKENKNTCLLPSTHKVWRVWATI